ncbi:hypothetical protein K523DRAFT_357734 [Schizophyllum commune Tattone D]|nr:hypothetical protein K523DRAFT_357734 [Schizophyllum commune Tattone D]
MDPVLWVLHFFLDVLQALNTLNDERSTIQHAVWDLSDSPISRVLLSRPWFFKTLKLLYSYHALVQDIKIFVHRTSVSRCSSDASPGEANEVLGVAISQEEARGT